MTELGATFAVLVISGSAVAQTAEPESLDINFEFSSISLDGGNTSYQVDVVIDPFGPSGLSSASLTSPNSVMLIGEQGNLNEFEFSAGPFTYAEFQDFASGEWSFLIDDGLASQTALMVTLEPVAPPLYPQNDIQLVQPNDRSALLPYDFELTWETVLSPAEQGVGTSFRAFASSPDSPNVTGRYSRGYGLALVEGYIPAKNIQPLIGADNLQPPFDEFTSLLEFIEDNGFGPIVDLEELAVKYELATLESGSEYVADFNTISGTGYFADLVTVSYEIEAGLTGFRVLTPEPASGALLLACFLSLRRRRTG